MHATAQGVAGREQDAAQEERAGHQQPIISTQAAPQQVRHHQTDKADRARQRDGDRRKDRAGEVTVDQRAPAPARPASPPRPRPPASRFHGAPAE